MKRGLASVYVKVYQPIRYPFTWDKVLSGHHDRINNNFLKKYNQIR